MTGVAFSIKLAKTNQKLSENSELIFVKIIHYYSKLFTGVLTAIRRGRSPPPPPPSTKWVEMGLRLQKGLAHRRRCSPSARWRSTRRPGHRRVLQRPPRERRGSGRPDRFTLSAAQRSATSRCIRPAEFVHYYLPCGAGCAPAPPHQPAPHLVASIQQRMTPIISRFRALGNLNLNFELTNRTAYLQPRKSFASEIIATVA